MSAIDAIAWKMAECKRALQESLRFVTPRPGQLIIHKDKRVTSSDRVPAPSATLAPKIVPAPVTTSVVKRASA